MTQSLPPKSLVLYADDDADDIALLQDAFYVYDHVIELKTFDNGIDLLHFLDGLNLFQPSPCLLILDINMPGLNGFETLRKSRNHRLTSDVPVVLFSTSTLPSEAAFAESLNAGFVTKPLNIQQMNRIVEQLLNHCTGEVRKRLKRR